MKRLICLLSVFIFAISAHAQDNDISYTHPFSYTSPAGLQVNADVGIWMFQEQALRPSAIADWLNTPCGGLEDCPDSLRVLEPINVLWVDFDAASATEAYLNVDRFLQNAGFTFYTRTFGVLQSHSGGYSALFLDKGNPIWSEQFPSACINLPEIGNSAFFDCTYTDEFSALLTNNHGRIFEPVLASDDSTPVAYLTSGAFSRESAVVHNLVSFNEARNALHLRSDLIPTEWQNEGIQDFGNIIPDNDDRFYTPFHSGVLVLVRKPRVDVGFVIDDTGSMTEEIDGVRQALLRHLDTFDEGSGTFFQLTTFKDGVNPRDPTFNLQTIEEQVGGLRASGGGDCPEASFEAIEVAQDNMTFEDGTITIATDAAPHPGQNLDAIITNLRERGIRVNVMLSGDCFSTALAKTDGLSASVNYIADNQEAPSKESVNTHTAVAAFSRLAQETGGVFAFIPEVNVNSSSGARRFENTVFNIVEGGIRQALATALPASGPQSSRVTIMIEGAKTNFRPGKTRVQIGEDNRRITVEETVVRSPTTLEVTLSISPDAPLGFQDILAFTDLGQTRIDTTLGIGAFEVTKASSTPTITSITPPRGAAGETISLKIFGINTNFSRDSEVSLGEGITVREVDVRSDRELNAIVAIDESSTIGFRDIVVQTGTEIARETQTGPFFVQGSAPALPRVLTVEPASASPGDEVVLTVAAENTRFVEGVTRLSFSDPSLQVLKVTVLDSLTLQAQVFVPINASVGFQDVRVKTQSESAVLLDGLFVTAPRIASLLPNYPNPFNAGTTIRFSLLEESEVKLTIFNLLGQEVATIFSGLRSPGTHAAYWDGADNSGRERASGVYIYAITVHSTQGKGTFRESKTMVLLH